MAVQQHTAVVSQSKLRQDVLTLAWPAIVEMMLIMTVGIVDTAMVGQLGPGALTAVGLANQVFMFGTTVFAAVATGNTALVARHVGASEPSEAGQTARQSLLLGVISALVVSAVLVFFGEAILGLLFRHTEAEVIVMSGLFMRIVAASLVLHYPLMLINGTLRGAGDTKTPMRITAVMNVINVIGNYVLIFGVGPFPRWGVAGAAAATAFSHGVGGLMAFYMLMRVRAIHVNLAPPYRFDARIIRRILNIGIPAAFEHGSMRVGQLAYSMIVASLGSVAYAAHQVALVAESLSYMPGFGFSLAATTLVGQNLGANQPEMAEKSGLVANTMAVLIMSAMGVFFFFFAEPLVSLFSPDPEVIRLGSLCLRLVAFAQPALATLMVLSGGLRGAGDTKAILKITIIGFLGVRLGLAYLLAVVLHYGLAGAWAAMIVDLFFRGLLYRLRYTSGRWKSLKI